MAVTDIPIFILCVYTCFISQYSWVIDGISPIFIIAITGLGVWMSTVILTSLQEIPFRWDLEAINYVSFLIILADMINRYNSKKLNNRWIALTGIYFVIWYYKLFAANRGLYCNSCDTCFMSEFYAHFTQFVYCAATYVTMNPKNWNEAGYGFWQHSRYIITIWEMGNHILTITGTHVLRDSGVNGLFGRWIGDNFGGDTFATQLFGWVADAWIVYHYGFIAIHNRMKQEPWIHYLMIIVSLQINAGAWKMSFIGYEQGWMGKCSNDMLTNFNPMPETGLDSPLYIHNSNLYQLCMGFIAVIVAACALKAHKEIPKIKPQALVN